MTDGWSSSVAVGDFDGDGVLDLAVGGIFSVGVVVLLGNGDGSFQPGRMFGAASSPWAIMIGDLNRDGKPDLVVSNHFSSLNVSVLINDTRR